MNRQAFYFSDGPYLQAMHGLHSALTGAEAFVKFIGQARTGKSAVCEKLARYMRLKDFRVIYFDYAVESPDQLHSRLGQELNVPDAVNILRQLESVLAGSVDKPLILIFDDAHQLSDITLIEIYRLASVQIEHKRVINIVLCGEPELEHRLYRKQQFTPLLQHVSHNFLLEPMDAETTSRFVTAFFLSRELPQLQLDAGARNQFYKSTGGFPGPAASLSELVVSLLEPGEKQGELSKGELLRVIRSVEGEQPLSSGHSREGNKRMVVAPIVVVAIVACFALLLRLLDSGAGDTEEDAESEPPALIEAASNSNTDSPFVAVGTQRAGGSPDQPELAEVGQALAAIGLTRPMLALDDEESPSAASTGIHGLERTLRDWLDAWEEQDLERYFASYAEDFVPHSHSDRSAWRTARESAIGDATDVDLEIRDLEILAEDAEKLVVQFWLAYRSASERADTHKQLILKKPPDARSGEDRLGILEEINLEERS